MAGLTELLSSIFINQYHSIQSNPCVLKIKKLEEEKIRKEKTNKDYN